MKHRQQTYLWTTNDPLNGQTHSGGKLDDSLAQLNTNWGPTWTVRASDKAQGHLGVAVVLPPGRWTWTVQLYHKQSAGKHVANLRGSTWSTEGAAFFEAEAKRRGIGAIVEIDREAQQRFGPRTDLGTVPVLTESGNEGSFQNFLDGGYQHPTYSFTLAETRHVTLGLDYTGNHYIWTGATNLTFTGRKRPFYNIKHAAQNIPLVDQAIAQGANAVEFDIMPTGPDIKDNALARGLLVIQGGREDSSVFLTPGAFYVMHPTPSPPEVLYAGTSVGGFLPFLRHLKACLDRGKLANLLFDCKHPGYGGARNYARRLIDKIREAGIPDYACTLSVPAASAREFIETARSMGFNSHFDSYLESYPDTVEEYLDGLKGIGTSFQGMGLDPLGRAAQVFSGGKVFFRQWLPWIMQMTNVRDSFQTYKKSYFWTVDDWVSLRNCLDYGVDGIITNKPDRLGAVLREAPYRDLVQLATLEDTRNLRVHGFSPEDRELGRRQGREVTDAAQEAARRVREAIERAAKEKGSGEATVFAYTGADQFYTVPDGVTKLQVQLWGAGGGQNGGSGAYVAGVLTVRSGEKLDVVVGRGGPLKLNGTSDEAFAGGGRGTGDAVWAGGSGGGRSFIRRGAFEEMVTAGAGGGGQYYGGGGGGIALGQRGHDGGSISTGTHNGGGGLGGANNAPGVGGGGDMGGKSGRVQGGGDGGPQSGGGGGGFLGGAGGGKDRDNGGGGGGASLIRFLANPVTEPGKTRPDVGATTTPVLPGGATAPGYVPGVGTGGANNQPGGNGLIRITPVR